MTVSYKVLREANSDDAKFAPQEAIVRDAIIALAGVGGEVDRDSVVAKIEEDGNLVTKQGTAKIVQYYQRTLDQRGIIEVIKTAKAKVKKSDETEEVSEEEEAA